MSVSATTDRPDVEAYLAAVRDELADLRPDERDDLLAEVEASLLDSAEESDAPIASRLGPPADFAAELRSAAGLGGAGRATDPKRRVLLAAWRSPRAAATRRTLIELAPIWWVVRAYVAVAALAWLADSDASISPPEVLRLGNLDLGPVVLLLAVAASVGLGLWQRRNRRGGTLGLALNAALGLVALPVLADAHVWSSNRQYDDAIPAYETFVTAGLARDGIPIENVYPYSRDGRLLLDVLLFDETGAPLDVRLGDIDPTRRLLRTRSGADVFNSFPIRHFEPGTSRVARPGASPGVFWSPIVTPPLEERRVARSP